VFEGVVTIGETDLAHQMGTTTIGVGDTRCRDGPTQQLLGVAPIFRTAVPLSAAIFWGVFGSNYCDRGVTGLAPIDYQRLLYRNAECPYPALVLVPKFW